MPDPVIPTPAEEVKNTEVPAPKPEPEKKPDSTPTVSEVLAPKEEPKEVPTVGLDKFLELKKDNKELKKALKDLEAKIATGGTASEDVTGDVEAIADEFNVDKKFLNRIVAVAEAKADKKAEEKMAAKLKPLEERERAEKLDKVFTKHFDDAIAAMPEYKDIANPDVIKSLSLDPKNAQKTFAQIIEDTYGNAVVGRRTIESPTPRGGKEPEEIDYSRASRDMAYYKEIMADPAMKAKYNQDLHKRLKL